MGTVAQHSGGMIRFIKQDNIDYYNEKIKPIIERIAALKQATDNQELAGVFLGAGTTHAVDKHEANSDDTTNESQRERVAEEKHVRPYTLQTWQQSKKSGLHKKSRDYRKFRDIHFQSRN
jgi:hypothetical protein